MECIWSEKDIICGRFVSKEFNNTYQFATGDMRKIKQIGFDAKLIKDNITLNNFCDGLVHFLGTREEAALYLTNNKFVPLPHNLLELAVGHKRNFNSE